MCGRSELVYIINVFIIIAFATLLGAVVLKHSLNSARAVGAARSINMFSCTPWPPDHLGSLAALSINDTCHGAPIKVVCLRQS